MVSCTPATGDRGYPSSFRLGHFGQKHEFTIKNSKFGCNEGGSKDFRYFLQNRNKLGFFKNAKNAAPEKG